MSLSEFEVESWIEKFRLHSPKTRLIRLSREVCEYLLEDNLIVRSGEADNDVSSDSDTDGSEDESAGALSAKTIDSFPELKTEVEEAIQALGGEVAPKVGSKSPVDASWANFTGQTKCKDFSEVLLLMKASDRVADDVSTRLLLGQPTFLILRKWSSLHPSMEFRTFIKQRRVQAICQRDDEQHYQHLEDDAPKIEHAIEGFFNDTMKEKMSGTEYVMDVYVDNASRVWLIDLAPARDTTDALLFTWAELDALAANSRPEFRVLARHKRAPAKSLYYGIPYELRGERGSEALAEASKRLAERRLG
ncbi:hypothetical protein NDN08_005450 [Rhodosorus marinus]|uniref:Cell division cycle protein 123 n=1 Tax=Rhodosorus marinus TaxID=101924 RepID=A0AAV8V1L2_9RHOD|nr:hypothetical protein NDN08_005450 [Rhodosorus marinus]